MRLLLFILVLLVENLVSASTVTFDYDAAGRLIRANYGGNTNTTFSYDNNGNFLGQSSFVSANPELAIAQAATPDPVAAGTLLVYAVTIFNNSSNAATSVKLTNALPANATYVTNTVKVGSVVHSGNTLTWTVGTLSNAAAATMTFIVRPTAVGTLTNTATAGASPADPYAVDNTNRLLIAVVPVPTAVAGFDDGNVSINWPIVGGENFTVVYSDSLMPPVVWQPVPAPVTVAGDWFYIEDPLTNTHRFYRLTAP